MSTAGERQARRRAKIKADPELYQAKLLKDRERKKREREAQREEMSPQQMEEHHLKERLRVRNFRSKTSMKPTSSTNQGKPYRSRQALGKAIKRLQHGSPRKQRFVVEKLARSVGVAVSSSSKKNTSAESEERRELVQSLSIDLMIYHGKHQEEKIALSFVKQRTMETLVRQLSKFAT